VHATSRFEPLAQVRRSAEMEAARRLARAGLATEAATAIEAELTRALARRCLAGDPLPEGYAVCPSCGLGFKEQVELPEADALREQAEAVLARQWTELVGHRELLERRAAGCGDRRMAELPELLGGGGLRQEASHLRQGFGAQGSCPTTAALCELLAEDVIAWLRQQLGQPKAKRRELRALEEMLRNKELTRREVLRIVEEWLGEDEGFVEVV